MKPTHKPKAINFPLSEKLYLIIFVDGLKQVQEIGAIINPKGHIEKKYVRVFDIQTIHPNFSNMQQSWREVWSTVSKYRLPRCFKEAIDGGLQRDYSISFYEMDAEDMRRLLPLRMQGCLARPEYWKLARKTKETSAIQEAVSHIAQEDESIAQATTRLFKPGRSSLQVAVLDIFLEIKDRFDSEGSFVSDTIMDICTEINQRLAYYPTLDMLNFFRTLLPLSGSTIFEVMESEESFETFCVDNLEKVEAAGFGELEQDGFRNILRALVPKPQAVAMPAGASMGASVPPSFIGTIARNCVPEEGDLEPLPAIATPSRKQRNSQSAVVACILAFFGSRSIPGTVRGELKQQLMRYLEEKGFSYTGRDEYLSMFIGLARVKQKEIKQTIVQSVAQAKTATVQKEPKPEPAQATEDSKLKKYGIAVREVQPLSIHWVEDILRLMNDFQGNRTLLEEAVQQYDSLAELVPAIKNLLAAAAKLKRH